MKEAREMLESLDGVTLKMLDAVQSQNLQKLKELYKTRNVLFDEFKKAAEDENISLPEAELSKFAKDNERLMDAMKDLMKKTKGKIEEISKNIELIQGYATSKNNFHINERR
ncbi:hypothetical protein [Mesoaciditoga lauensis]|uniref:hypothetical protein n=1 Tax=Mesoaciditoga lauensis TaxID=1495039 RepID=UPI00056775F5|nr:hypothetical protein [Mesoaciditoga lauensis]